MAPDELAARKIIPVQGNRLVAKRVVIELHVRVLLRTIAFPSLKFTSFFLPEKKGGRSKGVPFLLPTVIPGAAKVF
jgi:hypothetical protein